MPAPEIIRQLVEKFKENYTAYHSGKYNEAQLRQEFVDKFFEALGWDVYNKNGVAPDYRDVVVEDSLEIEGSSKAPDYAFKIGKERKFYVEAKKPRVDIQYDIHPAYQLKRYAWNAHLPLSILTDFEELAVYNCKSKPNPGDSAATGRDLFYKYTDYVEKWDEIAAIFSKEAVWKGAFDRFAETTKGKKGTTGVDDAILDDIENWRKLLALNIALRNPQVADEHQLNYAVQMTIDRILFLRICEDRGIEPEEQLKSIAKTTGIYPQLVELFRRADLKYNSGLFHFNNEKGNDGAPDTFTPGLKIDDKVLKEIITSIYYPCPYIFKEIPVEILGQVYEQFLGRVVRLTAGHQARIEEKPEVRKAGGVYYTPKYIVDYIVQNTVGKLLEGKNPTEAAELKIVDPACGSGSFLLGAFQYLIDWHEQWYNENEPEKWARGKSPALLPAGGGGWKLTTAKKKEILVNNIYGVDIDAQAVEVTKLSLLLKVLEEESGQLSLGLERALPDLGKNIQCGNSLIGEDYYAGRQMPMFGEAELYRVNPFDWQSAFPQVFAHGGFDAVIGNPPWGATFDKDSENYLRTHYEVALTSSLDSYAVFLERGFFALKENGLLGFITPDTFLRKNELFPIRSFLLKKTCIAQLIETGPVFSKVRDTWCLISILKRNDPESNTILQRKISRFIVSAEERLELFHQGKWSNESNVPQSVWQFNQEMIIAYLASEVDQKLINKIEIWPRLGLQNNKFKISRGEEGSKYAIKMDESGKFFMVIPANIERYYVEDGIKVNDKTLTPSKVSLIYDHPKVWIIRIQKMRWKQRIVCSFDERSNSAAMKTLQAIISPTNDVYALKFLSGILASKLINYWCVNFLADDLNQSYLARLPIRTIDFNDPADVKRHERMVVLVESMLALHKQLAAAHIPHEKDLLQRQIDSTDGQIDALVYELYGLTDEEIKIVEGGE